MLRLLRALWDKAVHQRTRPLHARALVPGHGSSDGQLQGPWVSTMTLDEGP